MIKGLQSGVYGLETDIVNARTQLAISEGFTFNLEADEIKTVNFSYKVTSEEKVGFYDFYLQIVDGP